MKHETKKREGPFSGALSGRGANSPQLIPAASPASFASLRRAGGKTFSRYFFFFLPAFFFILVLSFDLDFVAELLFLLTGIDTSFTMLLPDKHPKPFGEPTFGLCLRADYRNASA
jgi:hypothetical protein